MNTKSYTPEERLAILESKLNRNEIDITKLFQFIRDHMEKEEKQMKENEQHRKEFSKQLNEISNKVSNQKSFVGGMMFTVSAFWTFVMGAAYWIINKQ